MTVSDRFRACPPVSRDRSHWYDAPAALLLLALGLQGAGGAGAEDRPGQLGKSPAPPPAQTAPENLGDRPGYRSQARNPFAPTEPILNARPTATGGSRFERAEGQVKIPKMRLRGIVTGGDGEVAALLEIDGAGTHVVRQGDAIGLHEAGSDSVIRISRINRLNVEVEAGTLKQIIIVR